MEKAKAAMGFRSVKRVEVKAETTTPGEVRTTTDANGVRVSTSRARRTLPKLEFVVEENGAILHGPQRGLFPYYQATTAAVTGATTTTPRAGESPRADVSEEELTAMERASLRRSVDAQGHRELSDEEFEEYARHPVTRRMLSEGSVASPSQQTPPPQPMKDCVLNDTRATTLAIKYDATIGKFVCGSSIERFSGHTGVCRVLGSKKYPIIPHGLQIGDLLRIGSVGLVVCELNRGSSEAETEALTDEEYQYIRENYLSLPLQQTFRPNDGSVRSNNNEDCDDHDEDEEEDEDRAHDPRGNVGTREQKMRSGETSDEGESEEDGVKRTGDDDEEEDEEDNNGDGHENSSSRKKSHKNKDAMAGTREKRFCYICYDTDEEPEENPLVAPCNCKGDTKYVHLECLQRWNNNLDADGSNPNQKMCAVTNTDGLDVCSICKATYLTSVKLDDGRIISLMAKKLPPPYVTFAVVTQHEARSRSTTLTNTRFQLSFANLPRGQFLTIGRSTTNNMTLRYRTVSQLHAKVKFEDNNFYLYDASSSNGTMLFLSKPLELDWNKTMHVKIGRTILTLKSKKRWKWSTGGESEEEGVSSPRANAESNRENHDEDSAARPSGGRFDIHGPSRLADPSAELLTSPYAASLRQPSSRSFATRQPWPTHSEYLDRQSLNQIVTEILAAEEAPDSAASEYTGTPRRSFGTLRSYPDLPADVVAGSNIPRLSAHYVRARQLREFSERLSQMSLGSPTAADRLSAPGRFERS